MTIDLRAGYNTYTELEERGKGALLLLMAGTNKTNEIICFTYAWRGLHLVGRESR